MNIFNRVNDYSTIHGYIPNTNLVPTRGANPARLNAGMTTDSVINKLHLVKISNGLPHDDKGYATFAPIHQFTKYSDLCLIDKGALQYEVDDFLYCRKFGLPINKLITLRRFPISCTDNIYDMEVQQEPDLGRLITFIDDEFNDLDRLMSMSYNLKWKELESTYEAAQMENEEGGRNGLPDSWRKIAKFIDPSIAEDSMANPNWMNIDPTHDANKVYGMVDSIAKTNIRDIGLENDKDFTVQFQYEAKSFSGRTPEYVMRDLLAHVFAMTYNNAKFWGGARFWVGDRPSNLLRHFHFQNTRDIDKFFTRSNNVIAELLKNIGQPKKLLEMLGKVMSNALQVGIGSMMDKMGRPGVVVMNSILTGEPVGNWHLSIGNPLNPIISIGNLICTGVDIKFPTNNLSYGEFPTRFDVEIKLSQAMPRDRAGLEMMFNGGMQRIYHAPTSVGAIKTGGVGGNPRRFGLFNAESINRTLKDYYDFMPDVSEMGLISATHGGDAKTTLTENATSKANKKIANTFSVVITNVSEKTGATKAIKASAVYLGDKKDEVMNSAAGKKIIKVATEAKDTVADFAIDMMTDYSKKSPSGK